MGDVAKKPGWAFGKITDENVDRVIINVSNGWYAVAVLQAIALSILVFASGQSAANLVDPLAAGLAGYFLRNRKSRALAVALFLYALFILVITVGNRFGVVQGGGSNIILAGLMVYIGWRAIPATWFYQRRRCAELRWAPTILITLVTAAVGLASIFGVAVALGVAQQMGIQISPSVSDLSYAVGMFFPPVLLLAGLTMRWPFTQPDAACPWPRKRAV